MADRRIEFIINGHINPEITVNINIPQNFSVSPILFLIYINRIFKKVEEKFP